MNPDGNCDAHREEGGIALKGQRGAIVRHGWAQRWLELYERGRARSDVDNARRDARRGQVLALDLRPGEIQAVVAGNPPAHLSLRLAPAGAAQWEALLANFQREPLPLACLLAGDYPEELDALAAAQGFAFWPQALAELEFQCSCGEPAASCRHLGAVFYLVGERFDDDPFVLLLLRGRGRAEVLGACRRAWGVSGRERSAPAPGPAEAGAEAAPFYALRGDAEAVRQVVSHAYGPFDPIERLGFPPFFPQSDRAILQTLRNLCTEA